MLKKCVKYLSALSNLLSKKIGAYRPFLNTQKSKCFSALRRDQRLSARPVGGFVEALLQFKQSIVLVGIRQKLFTLVSVEIFILESEKSCDFSRSLMVFSLRGEVVKIV